MQKPIFAGGFLKWPYAKMSLFSQADLLRGNMRKYIFTGGPLKDLPRNLTYLLFSLSTLQKFSSIILILLSFSPLPVKLLSSLPLTFSPPLLPHTVTLANSPGLATLGEWQRTWPPNGYRWWRALAGEAGYSERRTAWLPRADERWARPCDGRPRFERERRVAEGGAHGSGGWRRARAWVVGSELERERPTAAGSASTGHATAGSAVVIAIGVLGFWFFLRFLFLRADHVSTCTRKSDFEVRFCHPYGKIIIFAGTLVQMDGSTARKNRIRPFGKKVFLTSVNQWRLWKDHFQLTTFFPSFIFLHYTV